ncbi:MAG: hydrogenase 3 maturation endopeptidase HyCI [Collinsella sp.]
MSRVVDGRVNGAPFAGIVLTAGSVLRADDAAGPVLSKKMEDTPIAGWYTIDGGQTPEDDIIEVKRERPPRQVLVDAADMALPVGAIRLLDKRDVARKSMFPTHSLPSSILIEEIEHSCEDIVFIGIQRAIRSSITPCPRRSLRPSTPCMTPWPPTTFPTLSAWGRSYRSACPC